MRGFHLYLYLIFCHLFPTLCELQLGAALAPGCTLSCIEKPLAFSNLSSVYNTHTHTLTPFSPDADSSF